MSDLYLINLLLFVTAPFSDMRILKFKAQPTSVFLLPSIKCSAASPNSDYCRARGNEIVEQSPGNETVLGSCRKLRGAAENLIDGAKNAFVG